MSQPVTIFDSQRTVSVRLTTDVATALGIADAEVQLKSLTLQGGMLLAEYQKSASEVTRYLLPAASIRYARQDITQSTLPPPAQG